MESSQAVVKVAVVGCGKIAERHLLAYRRMKCVNIMVTDVDKERARYQARMLGVESVDSLGEVLESDCDAVDVCVPTQHHYDIVMAALDHGKHVFCEKPLCMTVEEAEAIYDASQRSERTVMVGYLYRFHPAYRFARQVLHDGIIGDPYFSILRLGGRGSHAPWKHDAASGGGAVREMLVHMVDIALWLFGEFPEVRTHLRETLLQKRAINGHPHSVDAEDLVIVTLSNPKMQILCEGDLITPSYMNYVEVQGTAGSLFTSILHHLPTTVYCTEARDIFDKGQNTFHFPQANLFEMELEAFVREVRDGRSNRESVVDSIAIMRVLSDISLASR